MVSVGAILCVLLSGLLAHRLVVARAREKDTRAAVAEFKDSFTQVITDLTDREANPTLLITTNFPAHKQAAVKLLGRLPKKKADRFSRAWAKYHALHNQKASLGMLGTFAAEITDPNRALDPEHIYEVNSLRRKEAIAVIKRLLDAVDR